MVDAVTEDPLLALPWTRTAAPAVMLAASPDLKAYTAAVADGCLRCYVAQEDGLWHLSISHRKTRPGGGWAPGRIPTWEEIRDARYRFTPDRVTMAMLLPPRAEYVDVHPTTMHLWEVRR